MRHGGPTATYFMIRDEKRNEIMWLFLSKETSSEKNFGRNEKDGIYDRPVTGRGDNSEKSSSGR